MKQRIGMFFESYFNLWDDTILPQMGFSINLSFKGWHYTFGINTIDLVQFFYFKEDDLYNMEISYHWYLDETLGYRWQDFRMWLKGEKDV